VRMCAAQPSCERMVATLERQSRYLVGASSVRLFLVQRDGLLHHSRATPFPLTQGLVGWVRARKEIVNLAAPVHGDERFDKDIDAHPDRPLPTAIMCVPVEADIAGEPGTGAARSSNGGAGAAGSAAQAAAAAGAGSSKDAAAAAAPSAASSSANGSVGGKDIVAVFQAFKEGPGETFSNRDCKVLYRLGEVRGHPTWPSFRKTHARTTA